ncbi:4'-phosphopantetheinyl transferase superfamily protein [Streptomyces sp. NPDC048623]|uniref:4'-phosphopantetheinyl transferase family protein n=1 Tax=Streptomyces sp. NPDC048623 TaxID=3155761 RepID=UPI003426B63B
MSEEALSEDLAALLDAGERRVYESLTGERVRAQYVTAHALLRTVLGEVLGREPASLSFAKGPHGKPYLDDAALEFSLSHSGELVAVALSPDAPVGVDVERVPEASGELPLPVLSPAERAAYDEVPEPERAAAFTTYWVRKEAVLKATGEGLRVDPARLTVAAPGRPAALLGWDGRDGVRNGVQPHPPVRLYDLGLDAVDGYRGAVALLGGGPHRIVRRSAQLRRLAQAPSSDRC